MSIPALPADNANWKAWGTAIDAEARTIADKQTLVAAATGVTATDTGLIQTAIDAASTAGGGVVQLRAGTYIVSTLQIKTGVTLRGQGIGATVVKLANGTNADLVTVPSFSTLDAGNTSGGETKWAIERLTLDGNGDNQTGTSWALRVYAYNYRITDVQIERGLSGNAYSKWGNSSGGDMEAIWSRFKLLAPIADTAVGLDWNGPHDSIFTDGEVVAHANAVTKHQTGIYTRGNAGGDVFSGVHTWGLHQYGWILEHSVTAVNCEAEGSYDTNVLLRANGIRWAGRVFGTNGFNPTEVGVRVGDATIGNIKRADIDIDTFNWAAGGFAFAFTSSGGSNRYSGTGVLGTSTAAYTGSLNASDKMDLVLQDGTEDLRRMQIPQPVTVKSSSTSALNVGNLNWDGTNHHLSLRGGGLTRGYKSDLTTQTWRLDSAIGAIVPGTTAGTGSQIFSGTGAPTISASAGDFYFRKDTPTVTGQRLYVCEGGTTWSPVDTASGAATDVQVFTASGTWTKPTGAASVSVVCIGGGGGGGSGGRFASGTISSGGGGGGGGGMTSMDFPGATLGATVAVTVGSGGNGGAAQTTDSTAGIAASVAAVTTFGTHVAAGRGGAGNGGGNGVAGANGGGGGAMFTGGNGAASVAGGTVPSAPANSTGAPGGGAGGGITAALAASAGSAGAVSNLQSGVTGGAAGTVGAGQAGSTGGSSTADSFGTGGGGGAANTTAAAGPGGNGGSYGAGGAGGGASLNGFASGKGGDGAPGICVVITTF